MKLKSLALCFVAICVISEVSATFNFCGNNNEEVDVCNTCNRRRGGKVTIPRPHRIPVPRPLPVPLIKTICREDSSAPAAKPLLPIADVCNCGKQIIKPAPFPRVQRPSHLPCLPKLNFPQKSCSCSACNRPEHSTQESDCGHPVRAPEHYHVFHSKGAEIYHETHKKKQVHAPKPSYGKADVVSVAIARQLANKARNSISEKQLQYGSIKEPVVPERNDKKSTHHHVNEESIFETKGHVLELNKNLFHQKHVSSESESSEEEVKPQQHKEFHPGYLKYDDIGYGAAHPSHGPRYVVVKNHKANHDCPHKNRRTHFKHRTTERPCGCRKDLVVDQSEISEQSVSFENNSGQNLFSRRQLSYS